MAHCLHKAVFGVLTRTWGPSSRRVSCQAQNGLLGSPSRKVNVSHILVNADQGHILDMVEAKLAEGVPFESLAEQHSVCKATNKRGGQMGWLERGVYFPGVETVAYATPVGGRARATSPRGLHLLQINEEREEASIQQMSVHEVAELLANPVLLEEVQLVDVREPWEADMARLPGFKLFPLSQYQSWGDSIGQVLDKDRQTLVLCHHGVRSMNMSQFLIQQGFTHVCNITGGIDAYSRGVDSNVPTY